jgi:hypothetical protein
VDNIRKVFQETTEYVYIPDVCPQVGLQKNYGQYTDEISRKDYIELLGKNCSTKIKNRIGNLIYLAKPHYTLRLKPQKSKATHGGASKEEMETVLGFWEN